MKSPLSSPAPTDTMRPGAQVLAYLNIEGRSLRGVVLAVARQGIWVQVKTFPAPILFPRRCVRAA